MKHIPFEIKQSTATLSFKKAHSLSEAITRVAAQAPKQPIPAPKPEAPNGISQLRYKNPTVPRSLRLYGSLKKFSEYGAEARNKSSAKALKRSDILASSKNSISKTVSSTDSAVLTFIGRPAEARKQKDLPQ